MLPTFGTALIISSNQTGIINRKVLSNKVLVFIGLISYPLYLWHWPLLSFFRILENETPTILTRFILLVISFILAWLSYYFIENYFKSNKHRKIKISGLVIALLAIGLTSLHAYNNHGFLNREVVRLNTDPTTSHDGYYSIQMKNACLSEKVKKSFKTCLKDSRETPIYAIIGDSKAHSLFPGLVRTSSQGHRWMGIVGSLNKKGAPITLLSNDKIYKNHQNQISQALNITLSNPEIKVVVLTSALRAMFKLKEGLFIEDLPKSPNYSKVFNGLNNIIKKIIKSGKKVIITTDNPTLAEPLDCIDRKVPSKIITTFYNQKKSSYCSISYIHHKKLVAKFEKMLLKLESKYSQKLKIFNVEPYLCDSITNKCNISKKGHLLYSYTDHISDYAAGIVGKELNKMIKNF